MAHQIDNQYFNRSVKYAPGGKPYFNDDDSVASNAH